MLLTYSKIKLCCDPNNYYKMYTNFIQTHIYNFPTGKRHDVMINTQTERPQIMHGVRCLQKEQPFFNQNYYNELKAIINSNLNHSK